MSEFERRICFECEVPSAILQTTGETIPLPDGGEVVTELPETFRQPYAMRDIVSREGHTFVLSCGHRRTSWLRFSGERAG